MLRLNDCSVFCLFVTYRIRFENGFDNHPKNY